MKAISALAALAAILVGITIVQASVDESHACLVDHTGKCVLDKKKTASKDPPKAEVPADSKKKKE